MDPHNEPDRKSSPPSSEADANPSEEPTRPNEEEAPATEPAPIIPEVVFPEDEQATARPPAADFSTVGTGSVFAISCSLLTVLIIVICIGIFIITRLF
jgi:hypothetical protein